MIRIGTWVRFLRALRSNPELWAQKRNLVLARLRRRFGYVNTGSQRDLAQCLSKGTFTDVDAFLADLSKAVPVLVISRDVRTLHIGVPAEEALALTARLKSLEAPVTQLASGVPLPNGGRARLRRVLQAGALDILFTDQAGSPNIVRVDLYEARSNGLWVSLSTENRAARALYGWSFDVGAPAVLSQAVRGQTGQDWLATRPVDLVFTWVNHADPAWQDMRAQFDPETATDSHLDTRFHDNGELRHALRAAALYVPWARRIFIVSNTAPPPWLDPGHPRITWVDHSQILPPEVLPTFNSHAIETALHKIPGLSEFFVYFNDDMFLNRPLQKAWFFEANGASRAHMEPYGMVTGEVSAGAPDYLNAARTGAALVAGHFGQWPSQLHKHVPYALRKSTLAWIEETFAADMARTRASRFRAPDNISVPSFLYHHVAWHQGQCSFHGTDAAMVKNNDLRWRDDLVRALRPGSDAFCLNEGGAMVDPHWRPTVAKALAKRFPEPAPWERPGP